MTASKSHVRAVKKGEVAPKSKRPESVASAVEGGNQRDVNIAMQDRIAKAVDSDEIRGADLAALSRRLNELRKELAAMDAQSREAVKDESIEDAAWTAV